MRPLILAPSSENSATSAADAAICSMTAFVVCIIFDRLVARRFKRSYFALHVFANIIITALTLPGAIRALQNPLTSSVVVPGRPQPNALYPRRAPTLD